MRLPRIRLQTLQTALGWAVVVVMLLAAGSALRGCWNQHDRPGGHGDISFSIAPGGDELVFNADGEGGRDLYRLDLKTRRVTRIAATPEYEVDPCVSPDGKSVVYVAGRPGDRADHLFLRSLDGATVKQLTAADANDSAPAFSPDGSLIVFARDTTYNWGGKASNWDWGGVVCVIRADGTGLRVLTKGDRVATGPHFSPDGKTVLFWGEGGVGTVAAAGSGPPKPLSGVDPAARDVVYSPDGRSIAFSAVTGRGYAPDQRIFVARADGTHWRALAHPGDEEVAHPGGGATHPAFTPDGKRVLFFLESWPEGGFGHPKQSLWEIDEAGNPQQLADYGLFDDPLHWGPGSSVPAGGR
jgi:Tol biopolymer transport system component